MSNGHETGALEVQQKSYTLWAAFRERSFEGIALARQMFEVQQKMHIRK